MMEGGIRSGRCGVAGWLRWGDGEVGRLGSVDPDAGAGSCEEEAVA
jgi:hypothetical protein